MTPKIHLTTPAFFGTYQKGRAAARAGQSKDTCPYEDKRGGHHGQVITYSRSFISFWCDGWDDEKAGKPDRYGKRPKGDKTISRMAAGPFG